MLYVFSSFLSSTKRVNCTWGVLSQSTLEPVLIISIAIGLHYHKLFTLLESQLLVLKTNAIFQIGHMINELARCLYVSWCNICSSKKKYMRERNRKVNESWSIWSTCWNNEKVDFRPLYSHRHTKLQQVTTSLHKVGHKSQLSN